MNDMAQIFPSQTGKGAPTRDDIKVIALARVTTSAQVTCTPVRDKEPVAGGYRLPILDHNRKFSVELKCQTASPA